ncbi:adenylate/guanylate cyclase domain-containing protein [Cupriavidus consociatus]|uniref:adenylate/guanylate cyclase domain-containing protein n=1 Tax=Cupriavidus consociatus TaxID=2821357 RepID=UPI001AE57C09|nr:MULTISPECIES: adenylate/guanylate cyclase domain-containing protein [unclassified Cupriavidus]MBP0621186.1 AAA family ATPase [Cupriavidus sp. LEh25]MDK2657857.1 adenylate/guanylate cyclase domain-containing protein [Cupriavidus sp. LEh21]
MRCINCGTENPAAARFCRSCGTKLATPFPACSHSEDKFCGECGAPLSTTHEGPADAHQGPLLSPIHYTPSHLVARILAEQAAMEGSGSDAGERKTITALFADMAGSTALIHDLDPEEARRLIDPVIALMMEAVHHYEGYVAKSLGDGILALFGAPIAHEDHAHRALCAALRMQEAMRCHSDRIRLEQAIPLQIRVGIHTGEVVVRSIRKDDLRADYDPVGHTIHIASRMESIATPSSILVSAPTCRLTEGYFDFKALGTTQVKGIPEPLAVYEVLRLGTLRTRLQVAQRRGLAHFVGRQAELKQLHRALELTMAGRGQIVTVVGDAGIGKSRLFHEFKVVSQQSCMTLETFSVSHGKSFAYLPLIELVKNYFQIQDQDEERKRREKVAGRMLMLDRTLENLLPYLLYLLGINDTSSALSNMDPLIRRQRIFEAITQLFLCESANQPLELVFEDLQWLDSETEAFLQILIEKLPAAKILLLLNYRPEYRHEWGQLDGYTQIRLDPLGQAEAGELLTALLGDHPSLEALKPLILEKTEGNPFFIEEVVQTLSEEKALIGEPGHYRIERTPIAIHIPTTVQAVLAARIDRLPRAEKDLLQSLAVVGKEFSLSLIERVIGQPEDILRPLLARLEASEFIYEQPAFPDIEYTFKHALTQEVAGSTLLTDHRSALHERTGQAIEALFPDRLMDYCSELARHYSLSGNNPKAVEYLHCAGQQAVQRSAYREAIHQLSAALELLKRQRETPARARQELSLQLAIGPALIAARGFASPEVEATYSRALALCGELGDTPQIFPTQVGLRTYFSLRAEHAKAYTVAKSLVGVAKRASNREWLADAHVSIGTTLYFSGRFRTADLHLKRALALYLPEPHQHHPNFHGVDPEVRTLSVAALVLWFLGYPDQARMRGQQAIMLAQQLSHPFSLAHALCLAAELHQFCRNPRLTHDYADAAVVLSTEQGFPVWVGWASVLRGWAQAAGGQPQEGIAQMEAGIASFLATGARLGHSHFLALLAESYGLLGHVEAAQRTLSDAKTMAHTSGERYCEAELHRIEGQLACNAPSAGSEDTERHAIAQACFEKAISIARHQGAKSLELRASLNMAHLRKRQGMIHAAKDGLAEILGSLTEGGDTADLSEATLLLDSLGQSGSEK